jgi:hypothetical protein
MRSDQLVSRAKAWSCRAPRLLLVAVAALLATLVRPAPLDGATLPSGFEDQLVFSGLNHPTDVRFASDGRIFVAEKSGLIKVFHGLSDISPTVVADLRGEVDDYWDRGLLSVALDPAFPTRPYLFALYTFDAPIGGTSPTWNDACPDPPGPNTNDCVVSGRLARLQLSGDVMTVATGRSSSRSTPTGTSCPTASTGSPKLSMRSTPSRSRTTGAR